MDIVTLQAQIQAARKTELEADGVTFNVELPTEHAWRLSFEGHRDAEGRFMSAQAANAMLQGAIKGWDGLTARHLLLEAPADPLEFSAAARCELLQERQDIADELLAKLGAKLRERREARDAAAKN